MLGCPKFTYGEVVLVNLNGELEVGTIEIIDAFGTFFNPNEVCYDVLVERENAYKALYKHIPEKFLSTDF